MEERVRLLADQLTFQEKASLLYWLAPAIDRLGIKAYDHGNECLHGLVRPGLLIFRKAKWCAKMAQMFPRCVSQ